MALQLRPFLLLITLILTLQVNTQFIQRWTRPNGSKCAPYWRRDPAKPPNPVIIPTNEVVLEYNCYYLPAVC